MKTISLLLISIFSVFTFHTPDQEFIASTVRFSKYIETGRTLSTNEFGVIRLNNENDEFVFDVPLYSILTSPRNNDSITALNKKMLVHYKADFPVNDLDFLANDGAQKTFSIQGELTINNITLPVNTVFSLHGAMEQADEARGIKSYPVLVSFLIEINPAEYNLDFETINFVRSIYIEVSNGVINRTNGSSTIR